MPYENGQNENRKTKAMKIKNNVQKAILRSVAVVVSFVLISFTVSAQDFWKKLLENSSFNAIALAMVETSDEVEMRDYKTENFDFSILENETEPTLEMEEWMNDETYFDSFSFQLIEETETEMSLEEWMLDENLFQVIESSENPLELETWMTSEKVWKI